MLFKKIILILSVCAVSLCAYAEEKPEWMPDITAEVAFLSQYIWRGQTITDAAVFEPGVSISLKGFTASIWANQNLGGNEQLSELDYIFDYTNSVSDLLKNLPQFSDLDESYLDALSLSVGYTLYTFPNLDGDDFDSHEFYVGLSLDKILNPFITFYYDIDNGDGGYMEFGISQSVTAKDLNFDIGEYLNDISLDLGLTTGVNFGQWGYDESFSHMLFSWGLTIPVFKYFSVAPTFNYSFALDNQYESEFYAGAILSATY